MRTVDLFIIKFIRHLWLAENTCHYLFIWTSLCYCIWIARLALLFTIWQRPSIKRRNNCELRIECRAWAPWGRTLCWHILWTNVLPLSFPVSMSPVSISSHSHSLSHCHILLRLNLTLILSLSFSMSPVLQSHCALALLALAALRLCTAYSLHRPLSSSAATSPQLISKLLVQSPALNNVYMDYLVTSKPLILRNKYNKNGSKTKKTKKDSKIYFIPIPPLPYRYIPGIGYDYQPMKIKPILQDSAPSTMAPPAPSTTTEHQPTTTPAQSKILRVQHHKEYYFNGRPFRLQVAHADRKTALTPLNLKSNFYYNKNIIY